MLVIHQITSTLRKTVIFYAFTIIFFGFVSSICIHQLLALAIINLHIIYIYYAPLQRHGGCFNIANTSNLVLPTYQSVLCAIKWRIHVVFFLLDMLNELHMRDYLLQEFFTFLVTCLFLVLVINCQSILLQHTFDFNFLMLSIRNSKKLNRGLFCNALMLFLCYNNYFDFVKEEGSHMKSKIEQLDGFEKRRMLL